MSKYRRGVPDADMLARFEAPYGRVRGDSGDHARLLKYPPKMAVSALVNSLKACRPAGRDHQSTGRVNRNTWPPAPALTVLHSAAARC